MNEHEKLEKHKEKIDQLDVKIQQLKKKKRLEQNRLSEQERKARTKKLIEIGGHFEKVFGKCETSEQGKQKLEALKRFVQEKKGGEENGHHERN